MPWTIDQLYYGMVLASVLAYSSGYSGYPMGALLVMIGLELFTRRLRWAPTALDRPVLALLAVSLASALVSQWKGQSLGVVGLFAVMLLVTMYPVARVLTTRPNAIRPIVATWITGGVCAAAWGIVRSQPSLPIGASTPALLQNALGMTMALAITLMLGLWTVTESRWTRIAVIAGLPVMVATLELTWSRGAWIGAVIGSAVMVAMAPRRRLALVLLCALAIGAATLAIGSHRGPLVRRLETIPSLEANVDRLVLWRAVPRMVRDHPLLGTGFGTFIRAWPLYRPAGFVDQPSAHNLLLNFAAETGVLGLAAFLIFVAAGLTGLWRRMQHVRGDSQTDGLWVALFAATVAVLIQQFFDGAVMSWHVGYGLVALFTFGGTRISE